MELSTRFAFFVSTTFHFNVSFSVRMPTTALRNTWLRTRCFQKYSNTSTDYSTLLNLKNYYIWPLMVCSLILLFEMKPLWNRVCSTRKNEPTTTAPFQICCWGSRGAGIIMTNLISTFMPVDCRKRREREARMFQMLYSTPTALLQVEFGFQAVVLFFVFFNFNKSKWLCFSL